MAENVYYAILDHCYLAKYMNLESKNIHTVISNIETLLAEMKGWRNANVEFVTRVENTGKYESLILYTHNQKMADRVFKSGYYKTTTEDFLNTISSSSKESNILENKRVKMNETLNLIFKSIAGPTFQRERLLTDPEADLSDTLLSDLEEIGLSTIEREAIQENEVEPLPEDLFDDLSDEDDQVER